MVSKHCNILKESKDRRELTEYGFKYSIYGTFGKDCTFQVTDDPTPFYAK
jgi:hypothetical protein